MKKIKSYEDALKALNEEAPEWIDKVPCNVSAYHKLCTICEALNLGHEEDYRIYYPWWFKDDLMAGVAARRSDSGLANVDSSCGFRLCSFNNDTALYFGSAPFIKLWQEYLL